MWGLFACRLWGDLTRDGGVNAADSLLFPMFWISETGIFEQLSLNA